MTPKSSSLEIIPLHPATQELCVSVLLPFEPRAMPKKLIAASMKRLLEETESRLLHQTSRQITRQVLGQLHQLFEQLDYGVAAKSVVMEVSADRGQLVYWQLPVHEAVEVGSGFDVRQLLRHRKEEKQYLLLVMGDHYAGIYLGNGRQLSRLVANAPVGAAAVPTALSPANAAALRQQAIERGVKHFDDALSILQKAYKLPVFIVAPAAQLACFRQRSANASNAAALVEVPASITELGLQQVMAPYLDKWQDLKAQRLKVQLEQALLAGKLAVGISEVWTAAHARRGRVLVVENDYSYPAYVDNQGGVLYADAIPMSQHSRHTRDAVGDAMAAVLANGGQVEVLAKDSLADYVHVALITY